MVWDVAVVVERIRNSRKKRWKNQVGGNVVAWVMRAIIGKVDIKVQDFESDRWAYLFSSFWVRDVVSLTTVSHELVPYDGT